MVAMNASGITYNPVIVNDEVKEEKWDRIAVSDMFTFEVDPSMKKKADAWNISVQIALKRYIYDRAVNNSPDADIKTKKISQKKAQEKTLFVSALWHGLYPGYFVSFFHWGLMLQVSQ
jgi:hypothetical protein